MDLELFGFLLLCFIVYQVGATGFDNKKRIKKIEEHIGLSKDNCKKK